jgi:choline dehydrogenase-like flavoprotein
VSGFDVAIVGAGSTGSVLATRLSEDAARTVALIEAGPDYPRFRDLPEPVKYLGSEKAGPLGRDISSDGNPFEWGFVARATDERNAR